jgi:hypothetical protein
VECQTDVLASQLWMLEFVRRKPALRTTMLAFPDMGRSAGLLTNGKTGLTG